MKVMMTPEGAPGGAVCAHEWRNVDESMERAMRGELVRKCQAEGIPVDLVCRSVVMCPRCHAGWFTDADSAEVLEAAQHPVEVLF